jgi:hypothetical protein
MDTCPYCLQENCTCCNQTPQQKIESTEGSPIGDLIYYSPPYGENPYEKDPYAA